MITLLATPLLSFGVGLRKAITFGTDEGLSGLSFRAVSINAADFLIALAATIALAVLVWAGISYILSLGDEARTAKAKRTILYAILGLLVVGLASTILGAIDAVLGTGEPIKTFTDEFIVIITGIIQVLLAPAAVLAFGALVVGGYMYITSAGDESRSARAKRIILYALLGLLVIGIAGVIVNAVVNVLS